MDFVYEIIADFGAKEDQINKLFEIISQECMRLIEVIREKEQF